MQSAKEQTQQFFTALAIIALSINGYFLFTGGNFPNRTPLPPIQSQGYVRPVMQTVPAVPFHIGETKVQAVPIHLADASNDESNQTPLPQPTAPPSQQFGNLSVAFGRLNPQGDGSIIAEIVFINTNETSSIAVAMYLESCSDDPCPLRSSLTAGDGNRYHCLDSEISGIQGIRVDPKWLTVIEPGGKIRASLRYRPENQLAEPPHSKSFTLRAEIVVNQSYWEPEYEHVYEMPYQTLPFGCELDKLDLDISAQ